MPTIQPVLMTADLERLVAFYTEVFDAVPTMQVPAEGPPFYIALSIGDSTLGIVADDRGSGAGRILLSLEVDDVDRFLPDVERAGGRSMGTPNDMPWGQRVAHIQDPDGNAVNLTHVLPRSTGPQAGATTRPT